jgi:hypothetical protein
VRQHAGTTHQRDVYRAAAPVRPASVAVRISKRRPSGAAGVLLLAAALQAAIWASGYWSRGTAPAAPRQAHARASEGPARAALEHAGPADSRWLDRTGDEPVPPLPHPRPPPASAGPSDDDWTPPLALALAMPRLPPPVPAPDPDAAEAPPEPSPPRVTRHPILYQSHTPDLCLSDDLKGVLADIADRFGTVHVLSTYRDHLRNRRVGGALHSFHLACRAIDFRVNGGGRKLTEYLQTHPEVGGYKRYPLGFFHIDNGPRRKW